MQASANAARTAPIAPKPHRWISHGDAIIATPTPPSEAPACHEAAAARPRPPGVISGSRAAYGFITNEKRKKKPASAAAAYMNIAPCDAFDGSQSRAKHTASPGAPAMIN